LSPAVVVETFSLEDTEVFDWGLFKSSFHFGYKSHVVGVLKEVYWRCSDYFANRIFAIFVQLAFKYRQIQYFARSCLRTARKPSSERALFMVCRFAAKVHLYQADEVLHSVRLSVRLSRA